jgi:hypothetical protein
MPIDHATGADHALERLAPAVGGVELRTVFQPAAVLGGDQCAFDGCFAVARLEVNHLKLVIH